MSENTQAPKSPRKPRTPRVAGNTIAKTAKPKAAPRPKTYSKDEEWLIKQLRQVSIGWPPKERCLTRAWKGPGQYQCEHCLSFFKNRHELKADHVEPVVDPVEGYVGKGTFAERLFVEEDAAWQALCAPCHQAKTNEENTIRRAASKARLASSATE